MYECVQRIFKFMFEFGFFCRFMVFLLFVGCGFVGCETFRDDLFR